MSTDVDVDAEMSDWSFTLDENVDTPPQVERSSDSNDKKNKSQESHKTVGVFELFRYATRLDVFLMVIGLFSAALHGMALPLMCVVFGQMIDSLVLHFTGTIPGSDIETAMTQHALYLVGIGVAVLLLGTIHVTLFQVTAARQTKRIREEVLYAILYQQMAGFDTHPIGELNSRLTDDINTISDALGENISKSVQFLSTFISGVIIGLVHDWKLTLIILAATLLWTATMWTTVIDSSSEEGYKPDAVKGDIEFNNVSFSYPSRKQVKILQGLNLKVPHGKTIALVGRSGCGKSTAFQLLQRFYDPDSGKVTLDGRDIRSLNVRWLREKIGVVSQEPVLLGTTIAENIRYGCEDATDRDIKRALKEANAYKFISKLPDKLNTMVGERGAQLSRGQKQRIAIARALVKNPKILLLDQAMLALDTQSEAIVQSALDKARARRTTIVIAHRLSTICTADVIAVFDDGRVVEQGTHRELMEKKGVYYSLVMPQVFAETDAEVKRQKT